MRSRCLGKSSFLAEVLWLVFNRHGYHFVQGDLSFEVTLILRWPWNRVQLSTIWFLSIHQVICYTFWLMWGGYMLYIHNSDWCWGWEGLFNTFWYQASHLLCILTSVTSYLLYILTSVTSYLLYILTSVTGYSLHI